MAIFSSLKNALQQAHKNEANIQEQILFNIKVMRGLFITITSLNIGRLYQWICYEALPIENYQMARELILDFDL